MPLLWKGIGHFLPLKVHSVIFFLQEGKDRMFSEFVFDFDHWIYSQLVRLGLLNIIIWVEVSISYLIVPEWWKLDMVKFVFLAIFSWTEILLVLKSPSFALIFKV